VVFEDGRIKAVGKDVAIPRGAIVVNARGLHVYPGLIDAGSKLGLNEIDSINATIDTLENGEFQPDMQALTAVNPAVRLPGHARQRHHHRPDESGRRRLRRRGQCGARQSAVIDLAGGPPTR